MTRVIESTCRKCGRVERITVFGEVKHYLTHTCEQCIMDSQGGHEL